MPVLYHPGEVIFAHPDPRHSSSVGTSLSGICSTSDLVVVRMATQADVPLLAAMNERLIRDEGHRSGLKRQSLEPRMSRWLADDYRAAIFSLNGEPIGYALWEPKSNHVHLRP